MPMNEEHYPTVDIEFIINLVRTSDKVESVENVGSTTAFLLRGTSAIGKRTVLVRKLSNNSMDYISASGIAIRIGKMGELLKWYEVNKKWREGGYFV